MSIDVTQLRESIRYADLERYLFEHVTERFAKEGTLSAFDFHAIITWKSNRSKTKVRNGLRAAGVEPGQLMSEVAALPNDCAKLTRLDEIKGIGIPVASAILTVCYPDRFTVLDYRAWETLVDYERVHGEVPPSTVAEYFMTYLPVCKDFAAELGMSLRELDRALWGRSMEKGILALAAE